MGIWGVSGLQAGIVGYVGTSGRVVARIRLHAVLDAKAPTGNERQKEKQMIEKAKQETPEKPKPSRHVNVALSHLNKQRDKALAQRAKLTKEIESLDAAILALE